LRRHRPVVAIGFVWFFLSSLFVLFGVSWSLLIDSSKIRRARSVAVAAVANRSGEEDDRSSPHYEWLIVGGGIHGVGIAARLVGEGKIRAGGEFHGDDGGGRLLVVDEHPALLHSWKERTRATGMAFLRSAAGFHLDLPVEGLREFAGNYHGRGTSTAAVGKKKPPSKKALRKAKNNRNKVGNPGGAFVGSDYQRPALELFNDHCDLVVGKYGLEDYFLRGRVEAIDIAHDDDDDDDDKASPARVVIRTDGDDPATTVVSANNIVLAVGNDDPLYPEWALDLASKRDNHKISHLLQISDVPSNHGRDSDVHGQPRGGGTTGTRIIAIVGGGISAVHKALQLTSANNVNNRKGTASQITENVLVHVISRHPVREQQFDTHQDWMMTDELAKRSLERGGKGLTERQQSFRAIETPTERREVIKRERVPGTVPTYMTRARGGLEEAISEGKIRWHVAGIAEAAEEEEQRRGGSADDDAPRYKLNLTNGVDVVADEIILATGLGKRPPGHRIVHPLAEEAGLPLSPCGYPLVGPSLEWKTEDDDANDDGGKTRRTNSKIFVSGGLAELELGPSARNIAGARMAAERIASAAYDVR